MKAKKEKVRLQFDFSEEAVQRLDGLVTATESATRAEVIRNALRVYDYLVRKDKDGYEIELVKEGDGKVKPALVF